MRCAKILLFCTLGLFLLCNLALAWPLTGMLQEWGGWEDLHPRDLTILSDGSVWLVHDDKDADDGYVGKVFTIDPSDGLGDMYEVSDARFKSIDRDPDGILWITDHAFDKIYRFDPASGDLEGHPLPLADFGTDPQPFQLSVAPDGKVWFTCWGANSVGYYDPLTDSWDNFPLPTNLPCTPDPVNPGQPVDIALDDDGYVWFTIKTTHPGRKPGLGRLNPDTGTFALVVCPDLYYPITLLDPFGIAIERVLHHNVVWFVDHHTFPNQLLNFEVPIPAPLIQSIPLPDIPWSPDDPWAIWDAHFLALDPDHQFIWITAFGADGILIRDSGNVFSSLRITDRSGPMGIEISETGEVWWAESGGFGIGVVGGVGRFVPLPDSDGDGIPDEIDTSPFPSDGFSDGITSGIIDRGDQEITCIREINRDGVVGVRIIASSTGGVDPAVVISPCDPEVELTDIHAGDSVTVSCTASANVRVQVGPIVVELPYGIVVRVPSGAEMTVTEDADGALNIENSGDQGTITVEYHGQTQNLAPGQSIRVQTKIDIKPGSDPNSINCNNEKGVITVAILTTDDFDATTVDHTTVTFEGATETHVDNKTGEPRRHEEDVDGDGDTDLVFHFRFGDTALTCDSTEGVLTGKTFDGHSIGGTDDIRMVGGGGV